MNALTIQEHNTIQQHSFAMLERMADAMAKSGLFGMKTAEQALGLMLVAQAEKQHPASIAQDYDIIQGKATRKTHSVLARFQAAGGRVEWHQLSEQIADATFSHQQGGALRMTWSFDQAKRAGLTGKDNWKNYPRSMLRARCIAEGVRAIYPAAIGGMMVPEEVMDMPAYQSPIRNMEQAEVVTPAAPVAPATYPQDKFEKNLPAWRKAIATGKKTAAGIVSIVETKGKLTEDQKAVLRKAETPKAPVVTFALVADKLHGAENQQALDDAATLIGEVADPEQRTELVAIFEALNNDLNNTVEAS